MPIALHQTLAVGCVNCLLSCSLALLLAHPIFDLFHPPIHPFFPSTATMKFGWLKKQSLRTDDQQRTKASELTLKQSLYPIILVTSLFFLWVRLFGSA